VFNHELYASAFARAVELMRARSAAKDQQKAALRALVALASLSAASLRLYDGVLSVDDVTIPESVPHLPTLIERMQAHRVAELLIGRQSEPAELLALLRGLAAAPGEGGTVKERLRDVRSTRIMVVLEQVETAEHRTASVTQAFDLAEIEEAEHRAAAPPAPEPVGAGAGEGPAAPPAERDDLLKAWDALHEGTGELPVPGAEIELGDVAAQPLVEEQATAPAAQASEPEAAAAAARAPALPIDEDTPVGAALAAVVLDPYGPAILDRLTVLSEHVQAALREDQTEAALRSLAVVIDLEPGAPEGTPRNSYGIVLKRTLTREVLAQVAQCLLNPAVMDPAAKVMRRARAEGVEVLLGLLATAEGLRERRAFMAVLRTIPDGTDRVLAMLGHPQWFVVRNIAELAGELRIESAVGELGRLLTHHDQRVRRSAAVALAKIGSVATVEPLRRALKDGSPEVRSLIAASIGGTHARPLAMPLVALCESEENPDVLREYYRALGRIGSPEAIQALAKAAEPGGRLLGRKSAAQRLAALDGLRVAGEAAGGVLQSLANDADKTVREAAQKALRTRS
jgi:hypothetical protein